MQPTAKHQGLVVELLLLLLPRALRVLLGKERHLLPRHLLPRQHLLLLRVELVVLALAWRSMSRRGLQLPGGPRTSSTCSATG